MRTTALALATAVLVVLGAHVLAGAGEPSPMEGLIRRVELLESQAAYLRAREASLSAYVLANGTRAKDLIALADKAETEGFTSKALPAASRETLLAGLRAMAASLSEGLPALTPEETRLLKHLEALQAAQQALRAAGG